MTSDAEYCVLAGGCFWCIDAQYKEIKGVTSVVSGYSGGHVPDPTYEMMHAQDTGHAEAIKVTFNPQIISLETLFHVFFRIHDPTTLNRQGNNVGAEYRSAIFYTDEKQKQLAEAAKAEAQTVWPNPIVTEISPLDTFYEAEDYHQDYFANNPQNPYCQLVINPELAKFRNEFKHLLK